MLAKNADFIQDVNDASVINGDKALEIVRGKDLGHGRAPDVEDLEQLLGLAIANLFDPVHVKLGRRGTGSACVNLIGLTSFQ